MPQSAVLSREFFTAPALQAARRLLGCRLVRLDEGACQESGARRYQGASEVRGARESRGARLAGIIIETEAYRGEEDQGCHARAGRTPRTEVMYGPPGHAYVYFTYGMHWMLNFVVEAEGYPAAVLIRAIHPEEGLEVIASRRNHLPPKQWTNGPAKICQALRIDGRLNGVDLCAPGAELFVEAPLGGSPIPDERVASGPRVGLNNVPEPWRSIPWRFQARLEGMVIE